MSKTPTIDPTTATRPALVDFLKATGNYAGMSRAGVDDLRAAVSTIVKKAAKEAAAAAPTGRDERLSRSTHCAECGYEFPSPRASGRCNSDKACAARKAAGDPTLKRGGGSRKASTSGEPTGPVMPAIDRMARIQQAKVEAAAIKEWKAGGRKGQPPATPALDEMNGKPTVRQSGAA